MKKTFLIAIMMVFAAGLIFGACVQQGTQGLEARVAALENENKALNKEVTTLNDTDAINKLEMAYAYYLEHLMCDELAELFADKGELEWVGLGRFIGKENIRNLWNTVKKHFSERGAVIHPGPRFAGYITINPDGKTAAGRWYVAGGSSGMSMLCENRYVKENGVWKFTLLSVGGFPGGAPSGGRGGKAPDEAEAERMVQGLMSHYPFTERISRVPRQEDQNYLRPFSFKHPVTGKDVNDKVEEWNKAHPVPMPPGGEKWTEKQ